MTEAGVEGRIRELEHTADIGFELEADTLDDLFACAARGLLGALGVPVARQAIAEAEEKPPPAREADRVMLERPDLERLLVAWLRELLHRIGEERRLPQPLRVRVREGDGETPATLEARLLWRPGLEEPVREIKGVTYHGLRVRRAGDRWHATVVLDV